MSLKALSSEGLFPREQQEVKKTNWLKKNYTERTRKKWSQLGGKNQE
jgi:hypothetical protein